ncbi:hypothetical protein [Brachyspira sp.]|uniref:hypothetical protein n=1 Tax=Brachyspira sp. TaxID=1977261 RepID=UPI0026221C09|nr:hypothetical protein [Brachyspira sp.]
MFYILYIILAFIIFVTIFLIKANFILYIAIAFFILHIIFTRSVIITIKKLLYLFPYFLAIFIIQALNSRGEYYNLFGFYIDKVGADFTIIYFMRIASVLYFLSIFLIIIKKLKIPNGMFFDEMIRIGVFMKIVKKSFFVEFNKIRDKNKSFKDKVNLIKDLLENVYNDSFKLYPYDMLISYYRNSKK